MDGTTTNHKIVTGLCPGHLRSQSSPTPWAPRVRGQSINTTEDKGGAGTPTCATVIHFTWTQWHLRKLRLKRETPEGARKNGPRGGGENGWQGPHLLSIFKVMWHQSLGKMKVRAKGGQQPWAAAAAE